MHLVGPYYANMSEQSAYCGRCSFLNPGPENKDLFDVKIDILPLQHSTFESMTAICKSLCRVTSEVCKTQCNFRGL
jgi:hypothetical protein